MKRINQIFCENIKIQQKVISLYLTSKNLQLIFQPLIITYTISKSSYPENEQEFQNTLRIILDDGTFVQKFLSIFDSRITFYYQLTIQLKDALRDHQPKNTEKIILKLFLELIDIYDQEKTEILIEKQVETQNPKMKIEELIKKEFSDLINICKSNNAEISEKKRQYFTVLKSNFNVKLNKNSSDLNNFSFLTLFSSRIQINMKLIF
ncbi:unnamed protein product [Paramecium sonneborni]|uniref:Uncharacterized protein n=1 Tax=Paramecium sonneborni TaxID=65129 RepID=A0A8S1N4G7_9CILI|nr:unnamed protein product [Paramecium sonneborni]